MEDLSLHTKKITPIEFELAVEGLKNNPSAVRFVVENPDYDVAIPCKRDKDNKWSVDVPPLAEQKGKQYKYRIEVIVDGLFFEPVKGNIVLQTEEPSVKVELNPKQINEDKKPHSVPRTPKHNKKVVQEQVKETTKEVVKESSNIQEPAKEPVKELAKELVKESTKEDVNDIIQKHILDENTTSPAKKVDIPEDKPIPALTKSLNEVKVENNSPIPSLKAKIIENEQKKDPKYREEREKKVRAILEQIKQ